MVHGKWTKFCNFSETFLALPEGFHCIMIHNPCETSHISISELPSHIIVNKTVFHEQPSHFRDIGFIRYSTGKDFCPGFYNHEWKCCFSDKSSTSWTIKMFLKFWNIWQLWYKMTVVYNVVSDWVKHRHPQGPQHYGNTYGTHQYNNISYNWETHY